MIFVITVVKMLWIMRCKWESLQQIFTSMMTNITVDIGIDHTKPLSVWFLPQYQSQIKGFFQWPAPDTLMQAALSVPLSTMANWPIRLQHYCQLTKGKKLSWFIRLVNLLPLPFNFGWSAFADFTSVFVACPCCSALSFQTTLAFGGTFLDFCELLTPLLPFWGLFNLCVYQKYSIQFSL